MKIEDALAPVFSATPAASAQAIQEAASGLLVDPAVKAGADVAIVEDTTYGQSGLRGKVKGETKNKSGFTDIELPSGVIIPVQTTLLAVVA